MSDSHRFDSNKTEKLIERAIVGDDAAFNDLILHVSSRLCAIVHRILGKYAHVRRWEETDDVLQAALLRLYRSLREVGPDSATRFFGLASTLVRRTVIDLSRHYYGVYGMGAKHQSNRARSPDDSNGVFDQAANAERPDSLDAWTAFHEAIEMLPEKEKQVFSLMWYSGLTQKQIGEIENISERTVIRRMNRARLELHGLLAGQQSSIWKSLA